MPWIHSHIPYPVRTYFAAFQVFCSIRWQHRPVGLQMSVTKTLLMVGWHIQPLKTPFVPDLFLYPWPTGTQRSRPALGVRRKPVLATYTINHSHGWQCPISSWLQRSGCGEDAVWQGRLCCPCLLPGARLCPSTRPQQQLLCLPAVPALFVHFQRG